MTIITDRIAAVCRDCGTLFWDLNGHKLCDSCKCERVNGAGELELDDPDDVINRPQPTFRRSYALCDGVKITGAQLREACHAWQVGGSMMLGRCLGGIKEAKTGKRGFTTAEYGALVQLVREHTGDQVDYSQETT